jgi:hypothetical protein
MKMCKSTQVRMELVKIDLYVFIHMVKWYIKKELSELSKKSKKKILVYNPEIVHVLFTARKVFCLAMW